MNKFKLSLLLSFCLSITYTTVAQTDFDRLIMSIEAIKADPSANEQAIEVENIISLNTQYLDYSPALHKNGLVFSSNRPKRNNFLGKFFSMLNSNIYYTAEEGENFFFNPIKLPGKINNSRHQGAISFYHNDNSMIYTTNSKKRNGDGLYDLKLSSATFVDGEWKQTEDLPFSEEYRACHPAVSKDGSLLIFAAERPDGYGGMDLYISFFENGIWQKPQNMGPEINSLHDEVFPNLTEDGVLVFSSTGHNGCGGLDLFYAQPTEEYLWSNPINFGNPFNSNKDDFGFMTMQGGNKGCFSSNRLGGKGGDDLYLWQIQEEAITLDPDLLTANLLILDEATGIPLQESDISLIEINNNLLQTGLIEDEVIIANSLSAATLGMIGHKVSPIATTEKGHKYGINPDSNYFLMITKAGYNNVQRIVSVKHLIQYDEYAIVMNTLSDQQMDALVIEEDQQEIETIMTPSVASEEPVIASIILDDNLKSSSTTIANTAEAKISTPSTEINQTEEIFTSRGIPSELIKKAPEAINTNINAAITKSFTANNIYYELNKYALTSESKLAIDEIIVQLKKSPNTAITVNSHTDSRGKQLFNKDLSQKRADAVKMYMLSQGIEPERVTAVGVGESFLLNSCLDGVKCDEAAHKVNRRTEFIFDQQKRIIND